MAASLIRRSACSTAYFGAAIYSPAVRSQKFNGAIQNYCSVWRGSSLVPSPYFAASCYRGFRTTPPLWDKDEKGIKAQIARLYDRYENFLKKYPKVYRVHRLVVDGSKLAFEDLKCFYRANKAIRGGKSYSELSKYELEVLLLIPRDLTPPDLTKICGIVVLCAMPGTIILVAGALYFFPRLLLTRHFWTLEQKRDFYNIAVKHKKQVHQKNILKSLQKTTNINFPERSLKPSEQGLTEIDSKMESLGLGFRQLNSRHLYDLCRIYNVVPVLNSAGRLERKIRILRSLDQKIDSETLEEMEREELLKQMYLRELSSKKLEDSEMKEILKEWIDVSKNSQHSDFLISHAPLLFTFGRKKK